MERNQVGDILVETDGNSVPEVARQLQSLGEWERS